MDFPLRATPRFDAADVRTRVAIGAARIISKSSSLWKQRGLGTIFLKLGRIPMLRDAECNVEFEPDCRFRLPVFEAYWGPTVIGGRPYEPEVVHFLYGMRGLDATFVDCGANWGYYSVLATSSRFGFSSAVAIEASPSTFAHLRENARQNQDRFVCMQYAVSDRSGERMELASAEFHPVAHVRAISDAEPSGTAVETISLDDALLRSGLFERERFVVKLDVEGHEIAALAGAKRLREEKDLALVYEDFANHQFRTTKAVLADGYSVFYVRTDGGCVAVRELSSVLPTIAADGRVARPCNLVATKPGGVFERRLATWARLGRAPG